MTITMTEPAGQQQSSSPPPSGEEILVLYGSQTGNSESAAEQIQNLVPSRLLHPAPCRARCMQLDDFLEFENAKWTRLIIIVCSSYGVGQAPLGARKFREFCDAVLEEEQKQQHGNETNSDNNTDKEKKFLKGVRFALLGLGDSHYTTFFQNPTAIHDAMTAAGATRVGELGKADASGTGEMEQSKVIERWIEGIWDDLAKIIATKPPPSGQDLEGASEATRALCFKLFPEWKAASGNASANYYGVAALGGVMLSMAAYLFLTRI